MVLTVLEKSPTHQGKQNCTGVFCQFTPLGLTVVCDRLPPTEMPVSLWSVLWIWFFCCYFCSSPPLIAQLRAERGYQTNTIIFCNIWRSRISFPPLVSVKAVLSCASLALELPQESSWENHAGEAPLQARESDLCSEAHEKLHEDILSSVLFSCPNLLQKSQKG